MALTGYKSRCQLRQETIVSEENGHEHRALNVDRDRVFQYHVDGEVITEGNRCDFLLLDEDKMTAYLIELKGNKLPHALKQLEQSADRLKGPLSPYRIYFRCACEPRTHDMRGSEYRRFMDKYPGRLLVRRGFIEERI